MATLYLSNLLRLLVLLDANNDSTDGFQIDTAANTAIGTAVTGTRTLDFAASATAFAGDATVVALATALNRTLVSADEALVRYQLLFRQSRSSSIALTGDDNRAVVVNRQKASVSVIRVRNTDGTRRRAVAGRNSGGHASRASSPSRRTTVART